MPAGIQLLIAGGPTTICWVTDHSRADDPTEDLPVIDVPLVRRLLAAQFPAWAGLPVTPVQPGGIDNRTFRLGAEMSVRLPSKHGYRLQVDKEHRWLPVLAPLLPLPIPMPLAKGSPAADYPYQWSVYRWLDGATADVDGIADPQQFATDLASFLRDLERIDATDGPLPGPHNFFRGGPLQTYDDESRRAIRSLVGQIDTDAATEVWENALAATWHGSPVWFHGDISVGNLLIRDGRLAAVIDFGTSGVGDPSCDLAITWTALSGPGRAAFRRERAVDPAMWARGRGWTLWKALITLEGTLRTDPPMAASARSVIDDVLADHRQFQ